MKQAIQPKEWMCLAVLAVCVFLQPLGMGNGLNQSKQEFSKTIQHKVSLKYLLYLPDGYKKDGGKKWPLLLFLHGAGERGNNLELITKHGPPKLIKNEKKFPFIVVSPQCPKGSWWDEETLNALLDEIISEHIVDQSRVYCTGLSMGGFGTWSLAARFPNRFAAIAPVCGGGS